ncbi:MFS transporter [Mumia sp. zg.B53]|uniref:MFS transporter n=1 Tax=Mumia sp. zg.B53 TaxID=2855449 RepID=UPI001C6E3860|nr:MFS transporter [Mumia sp. zg.B53]MBW9215981.1 MFS transporter [Mumia sp. zg.B53]
MTDAPRDTRWGALVVCLTAGFMTLLDVSIVNVALPSIRSGLEASDSQIQLIVAGYSLAFGIVLVPAGRLGDALSRKVVFCIGLVVFTTSSALAGAASDPAWLAAARILQGVGGGLINPQVSGFIQNMFRGDERARAFGLFGATVGISTAVGPLLGGVLVTLGGAEHGWRYVFFVNVPVGIVALVLALRWLPRSELGPRESLDPVGVLLFGAATFLVLLPLVEGTRGESLSSRPWWVVGVALALLGAFAAWERWWARSGRATLVDLSLVRIRSYMLGLGLGTLYFAGFTSIFLVLTLYLQNGLGYTAFEAGLTQMPFALGSAVAAWLGGRLVNRYGRALVVSGLVLVIVGLVGVDLLVPHLDDRVGLWLAPLLIVAGFGGGLVISPNVTITLSEVDVRHAGAGGGMLQTAQRVGSAIGVALVLAQFFSQLESTDGDYVASMTLALRTTVAFVVGALVLGLVDLLTDRRRRR